MNHKPNILCFIMLILALSPTKLWAIADKDPRALVEKVVEAVGSVERLRSLKDVEYTYIYRDASGKIDLSTERYIFDGELSWAKYAVREMHAFPDLPGKIVQGYDGQKSWMTIDGNPVHDPKLLKPVDFMRKTNFYWFTMMFKLLDPGSIYSYEGVRRIDGIDYDLVKLTFEKGVGDVSDIYLLYINPKTHLVDQFLFTVMDFGMVDPLLMKVSYEDIQGLKLPTMRKYTMSNWEGTVDPQKPWTQEISVSIRFNNNFQRSTFHEQGGNQ